MAGLHSVYLINVNQACPGHRSLFPTLFLEGQREVCWCQKRQTRGCRGRGEAAPAPEPRPGTLGVSAVVEEADGGRLQVSTPWEAGTARVRLREAEAGARA